MAFCFGILESGLRSFCSRSEMCVKDELAAVVTSTFRKADPSQRIKVLVHVLRIAALLARSWNRTRLAEAG